MVFSAVRFESRLFSGCHTVLVQKMVAGARETTAPCARQDRAFRGDPLTGAVLP
jgi:hypothetical protein